MKTGFIAIDFAGASDVALTLAEAGMLVVQFNGVPTDPASRGLGACEVATSTGRL
ncbi:MAG: hypothetical protein ABJI96_22425 [Paracoccaceae bacterium]